MVADWKLQPDSLSMERRRADLTTCLRAIISWDQCHRHWHNFLLRLRFYQRKTLARRKKGSTTTTANPFQLLTSRPAAIVFNVNTGRIVFTGSSAHHISHNSHMWPRYGSTICIYCSVMRMMMMMITGAAKRALLGQWAFGVRKTHKQRRLVTWHGCCPRDLDIELINLHWMYLHSGQTNCS